MNIGVDLDCTLADFQPALISFHNYHYKTNLVIEDFWTFTFHKVWGGSSEEGRRRVNHFYKTKFFRGIQPITGAVEAIRFLKEQGHQVYIVTARVAALEKPTKRWVEKYFPGLIDEIYFSNSHYAATPGRSNKSDYCLSLNLDYLIEDDPNYAADCHSEKTKVVMLDWPWNRKAKLPAGVIRVNSWAEVTSLFEGMTIKEKG
jgi:uncharacterized HAD superfamily protein